MTRLTPEQEGLIQQVGRKWLSYKAEVAGMEKRIRKRVEAEMQGALSASQIEVAEAARVALEGGATKVALRKVTSKHPGALESLLALLDDAQEPTAVSESSGLNLEWGVAMGVLRISLDPSLVRNTTVDRQDAALWGGDYEVYRRTDGKVFIDPMPSAVPTTIHGVTEWLRADRANEEVVIAWVTANPQG